ncbi:acetyl-CoA carboxylase biotin carboxyl carrier protein [Nocardia sp. GCM10030253]|uniref:acetyl-CoA carboxylase biotin carboxyl carrier protein n=1 Tax=Nocardia sp. GCM10030253 TaxID=3273404 RepID=UPI0036337A17
MTTVEENVAEEQRDYLRTLEAIQTGALRLLAGFPRQPSALRIQVGEVTVEAEWAVAAPTQAAGSAVLPDVLESAGGQEVTALDPVIRAPSVGVFYRCPEPGADPFVAVGDRISAGQQIAIVEAMKLMIPVHAPVSGVITGVLHEDNEPVQFDDALFSYVPE